MTDFPVFLGDRKTLINWKPKLEALVTNATHTGEVTGATALTVDKTAITNKSFTTPSAGDSFLFSDVSDSSNLKSATLTQIDNALKKGSVVAGVEFVANRIHLGNIVYGKTWNFTSLPDATFAAIQAHGLTGTYSIIEIKGVYRQASNQFEFNIPCGITGNKVDMYKNDTNIFASTDFNAATGGTQASGTFTIYYIKA